MIIKITRVIRTVIITGPNAAHFDAQSVLVLLDAFWTYDLAKSLRYGQHGAGKVVALIYDLIPLNYGEFVVGEVQGHFKAALPILAKYTSQYVCISQFVADEVKEYLVKSNLYTGQKIEAFGLGSDFKIDSSDEKSFLIRAEIKDIFSQSRVWLSVGTIEPRKNYEYILDAFEIYWQQGGKDKLFIVGRIGWHCDDLLKRIATHPELNKKLWFMYDVSDEELKYGYRMAQGLIFASYVEGFGLPIVEAMASGIRVLCSDIPIFHEVGGDYPQFFSLKDPKELVGLVANSKPQADSDHKASTTRLISWDDSARQLMEKVLG